MTHGYADADWPCIDSFFAPFRFLSNFYLVDVELDENTYSSVEHAYQASKSVDPEVRRKIRRCLTPGEAKAMGSQIVPSEAWRRLRITLMRQLIEAKFVDGSDLARKLLSTGSDTLVEGNGWNDTFWGMCDGQGTNHLGNLLMRQRSVLQGDAHTVLHVVGEMDASHPGWELVEWATTRFGYVVLEDEPDEGRRAAVRPVAVAEIEATGVMAVRAEIERVLALT